MRRHRSPAGASSMSSGTAPSPAVYQRRLSQPAVQQNASPQPYFPNQWLQPGRWVRETASPAPSRSCPDRNMTPSALTSCSRTLLTCGFDDLSGDRQAPDGHRAVAARSACRRFGSLKTSPTERQGGPTTCGDPLAAYDSADYAQAPVLQSGLLVNYSPVAVDMHAFKSPAMLRCRAIRASSTGRRVRTCAGYSIPSP